MSFKDISTTFALAFKYSCAKVVEMSLKLIRYDDLQITPEAYAELVKRMSAAKLIVRIPEYEDFVDRTLLP